MGMDGVGGMVVEDRHLGIALIMPIRVEGGVAVA
jgi:hypothetical protein